MEKYCVNSNGFTSPLHAFATNSSAIVERHGHYDNYDCSAINVNYSLDLYCVNKTQKTSKWWYRNQNSQKNYEYKIFFNKKPHALNSIDSENCFFSCVVFFIFLIFHTRIMAYQTFLLEYMQIPIVTRLYTTACVITTIAVVSEFERQLIHIFNLNATNLVDQYLYSLNMVKWNVWNHNYRR